MASFRASRKAQSSDGPATVLAIGTANPRNVVDQLAYPDFYFRVTNADDRQELKDKFKRICKTSSSSPPLTPFCLTSCLSLQLQQIRH
ncbi:unnamed protein product [Musa acuminata subsp. burmannicoides]|uniref:Chalcone/stilbene synthase N-terminal domain-containing protein n=1 Tax=Musa acuminata subsp. malaccensis TaxID=214687 RepID=A0A804LBK1_MUSAM